MDNFSKRFLGIIIFFIILVLSFFVIRPILLSAIVGILFAFMLTPLYNLVYKITKRKSKDLAVSIVCLILLLIIVLPIWFLAPLMVEQSIKVYATIQKTDFVDLIEGFLPSDFASSQFSSIIATSFKNFVVDFADSILKSFTDLIFNIPQISLRALVMMFTFYFVLRDKEELISYIRSLLPFSKEVENKFFDYSKSITYAVLYGQIIIGIIQGMIAGLGFFIFGVSNALFLTLLACLGGILPIVGTVIVWLPVVIFLVVSGSTNAAFGVIIFGVISSSVDNLLRPFIISRSVKIHSGIVLIGMIGGIFLFGVLGFILGPLILSYLIIMLELFRNKKEGPGIFEN